MNVQEILCAMSQKVGYVEAVSKADDLRKDLEFLAEATDDPKDLKVLQKLQDLVARATRSIAGADHGKNCNCLLCRENSRIVTD